MNNVEIEDILAGRGVKPTANRILVLKALQEETRPVSLADLERPLYPMDKASIFRTLELFAEKEVVHVIEDGSRSLKYELCHSKSRHSVTDQHVHFYCEKCGEVYCFDDIAVPQVEIPAAFQVNSINFMLKGICPECDKRQ